MNKEKMRGIVAKIYPIFMRLFAVVGVIAVLMCLWWAFRPYVYRALYSRASDEITKPFRDKSDIMRSFRRAAYDEMVGGTAEELCNLYPKEEVCVSWRARLKCEADEKFKMLGEDFESYAHEGDVYDCFVARDEMFDDDEIEELPVYCRRFKALNVEEIWGKESAPSPFQKIELSGSEQEWSQKITPGHLAGIARALRLIITENEEVNEDLAPVLPLLDSFEMFEENGADKEMATGLFIGLYNSAVTGGEVAKKRVSEENRAYCDSIKGEKIIPVRCRIPMR